MLLMVVGTSFVADVPDPDAPAQEIGAYLADSDDHTRNIIGACLWVVGALAFLWFLTRLRSVLRAAEGGTGTLSNLAPGSGSCWRSSCSSMWFPSGQEGDVVLEADGVERYRWSRDKAFVLMITERELDAGETWSFALDDVLDVEPGRYSLVAVVTATPRPPVVEAEISVD